MTFRTKIYFLTLSLVLLTILSLLMLRVYDSWKDLIQQEYTKTESIAKILEDRLRGTYINLIHGKHPSTYQERIMFLNNGLQPLLDHVLSAYPEGYGAGYYAKGLRSIVAFAPNFDPKGLTDIPLDSPVWEAYHAKQPLRFQRIYSPAHDKEVIATVIPIIRNGIVIGHVWGTHSVDSLYQILLDRLQKELWIWLLLLFIAVMSTRLILQRYIKHVAEFRDRVKRMDLNLQETPGFSPELMEVYQEVVRSHQQVLNTKEQLQNIFDSLDVAIWSIDWAKKRYIHISTGVEEIYGFSPEDFQQDPALWKKQLDPGDQGLVKERLKKIRAKEPFHAEYRIWTAQGEMKWVAEHTIPVCDDQGQLVRLNGVIFDITERKMAEKQLRLAHTVVENMIEGIMVTDEQGIIRSVNPAFSSMTGYEEWEVIGQRPILFKSHLHHPSIYEELWACLDEEGIWQGEIWNRKKNGEVYPEWKTIIAVKDEKDRVSHYVSVSSDLSMIKQKEDKIKHMAYHDALTSLPNHYLFCDRAAAAMGQASHQDRIVAVFLLDLDRFKHVNDSLGHTVGDDLLRQVADRLQQCVREGVTVARRGGDEFMLVLPSLSQPSEAIVLAEKILDTFREPYFLQEHELFITASIGISFYPVHGDHIETLIKQADLAMYAAKSEGNGYQEYTPSMNQKSIEQLKMESHLRRVLELEELEVYYQPQYDLSQQKMFGVEALARWKHPEWGMISPAIFIPMAEELGLIVPIGEWVLRMACRQMKDLMDGGHPAIQLSVNLSGLQFKNKAIIQQISHILQETGFPPEQLELEITESMAMDAEYAMKVLQDLKKLGLSIAIDDFGTGYSSLRYIQKFPIDTLKIDQSFVREMFEQPGNQSIITMIIVMAHHLGIRVIAEGVETKGHLLFLKENNCDIGQGYFFSKPLPAESLESLFRMKIGSMG